VNFNFYGADGAPASAIIRQAIPGKASRRHHRGGMNQVPAGRGTVT
jgi:hypothetical protein